MLLLLFYRLKRELFKAHEKNEHVDVSYDSAIADRRFIILIKY